VTPRDDTRKKILDTTLRIIGEEDLRSVTLRRVARESGANQALIKYYFGNKAGLINESMKSFGEVMGRIIAGLSDEDVEPEERLRRFVLSFNRQISRNPGFTRSMMFRIMDHGDRPKEADQNVGRAGQALHQVVREIWPERQEREREFRVLQVMSAMICPVLMGPSLNFFWGGARIKEEEQESYIDVLLGAGPCGG
jgi:TetR/AcrR family transcriptional regulator, regulator of cefoperazone and chloramphenicol sensitivity